MSNKVIIHSTVTPLPLKDVDTDMILPAQYLTETTTDILFWGEKLFSRLKEIDPEFPTNLPKYQTSEILVARTNFGCGSSREHAVWSLLGAGYKAVIAPDFADIFFSNAPKNGLILVRLPEDVIEEILVNSIDSDYKLTVNLPDQKVILPDGREFGFPFDKFRKDLIINNLDDLGYILEHNSQIESWNKKRSQTHSISLVE